MDLVIKRNIDISSCINHSYYTYREECIRLSLPQKYDNKIYHFLNGASIARGVKKVPSVIVSLISNNVDDVTM